MTVEDWTLTVKKADHVKWGMQVQVSATFKGEPVDPPGYWQAGTYGWYVADEGGKRMRGNTYGGVGIRPGWGGNPNPAPTGKGEHTLWFQGTFDEGVWSMTLVLPKTHETKEYPFTIKDVPVP